jgi:hypothetical protein
MGKYLPLGDFLRKQRGTRVPMTFAEIERLIGSKLPNSRRYPAWWSNNPFNNVMTQVWLDAGFKTEDVDVEARKVVFRRVGGPPPESEQASTPPDAATASKPHPLVGWMKDTVCIALGVDLTEPADPDWAQRAWENKG